MPLYSFGGTFYDAEVFGLYSILSILYDLRLDAGFHARHLSTHAQQQLKQLARSRALPVDPSHNINIL
jgi:hypothetical protein